jgi:hypothetical protein
LLGGQVRAGTFAFTFIRYTHHRISICGEILEEALASAEEHGLCEAAIWSGFLWVWPRA